MRVCIVHVCLTAPRPPPSSHSSDATDRWYDHHNVKPHFPFGHGLSYTTFSYANLKVSGMTVSVDVKNTGPVAGAEVAQLCVDTPPSPPLPPVFQDTCMLTPTCTIIHITLPNQVNSIHFALAV